MNQLSFSLEQLQGMIGLKVLHHQIPCRVVEVLEDGPALVLENTESSRRIQADQYGEAHRKVPATYLVPILTLDLHEFSPTFLALEPQDP